MNSWSKVSFTRLPFVTGTFAVSPCLSSTAGHLGKYLHAFINFSHIFAVVGPLQLVKGELGERTFRHIDYKMYTGVVLPGGENRLPSFCLSAAPWFELSFRAAARLSYRLLPVVKPYRSKQSVQRVTIDKKTIFSMLRLPVALNDASRQPH